MTDSADTNAAADTSDDTGQDPVPAADQPPTVAQYLLSLQAVDTEADQLSHRLANSPLIDALATASDQSTAWERQRATLVARIGQLGASIDAAETRGAELLTHRQRLDKQLKTVIAPREAEALMHEIATIEGQRDELDIQELEALEEQTTVEERLNDHLGSEASTAANLSNASAAVADESAQIEIRLAELSEQRSLNRAALSEALLTTYDRKRAAFGVAVAPLVGKQCQGCHLELSAAEIDKVKDEAASTGVTDCPDCGRLLIV